jgi:multiple sugar transport system substrate-binding protein
MSLNGFVTTFQESHPNVTIQFDTIPFTDYIPKVTLQLAGSNPPDGGCCWRPQPLPSSNPAF